MRLAACVYELNSGRVMELRTTEPGPSFYTGNILDNSLREKSGAVYLHRSGFSIETEHYPDEPSQPDFPSTILRRDER